MDLKMREMLIQNEIINRVNKERDDFIRVLEKKTTDELNKMLIELGQERELMNKKFFVN